jgi:signal transduction histidine kinase
VSEDALTISGNPPDAAESGDRYTELAELAGGFIHEIKNQVGTIRLSLENLGEDFQDPQTPRDKRIQTKIQRLIGECQRVFDVSSDFLRFARINDLERHLCDLADVVDELIEFYTPTAEKAGINIIRLLPADLPTVRLNREMFKQALLNLLLNAQQAMPSGGDLTIQANVETTLTSQEAPRDSICLSIIDTGVGMSPETASRIFRPFFSTRAGGTGLGLPTTRKIIEAHDGTIEVQSAVGRGTRFAIRLPLAENSPGPEGS